VSRKKKYLVESEINQYNDVSKEIILFIHLTTNSIDTYITKVEKGYFKFIL